MHTKNYLILFFSMGYILFCKAQVSGKIADEDGVAIPYTNVLLLNATDSTMVKGTLSNDEGRFAIDNIADGTYILTVNLISYSDWFSSVFNKTNESTHSFESIVLKQALTELAEIELTATKRIIEQRKEGTVINVQESILTKGSSALQLLERSPGVLLDQRNGDFSLNGKSGTVIMINGRPIRVPTSEIMTLLSGISGDNIKKIELLTNPSSKYDADGDAGIINIVLSKGGSSGFNGSFSITGGTGYGPKQTTSLSLNSSTEKRNIYGSYSFSYDNTISDFSAVASNNVPVLEGETETIFQSDMISLNRNHNLNLGMDHRLSEKSEFGIDVLYNFTNQDFDRINKGSYTFENNDFLAADINVDGTSTRHNLSTSAFYSYTPDDSQKVTLISDYIHYKNTSPTFVTSIYTDINGAVISPENDVYDNGNIGRSETTIDVGVIKIDYEKEWDRFQMEAGAKFTLSTTSNENGIEVLRDTTFVTDPRFDNTIEIDEKIGAVYASVDTKIDSLTTLTTGIRYEYWDRKFTDATLDRSFGRIFPSVFLSKQFVSGNSMNLSYTKRISRPSYGDLSPSLIYNDPTSVFSGNPLLRPAITNTVSLSFNYNSYQFSMGYSYENNPIVRFQTAETEASDLLLITPQNVDFQSSFFIQATTSIRISDWWKYTLNTVVGTRKFKIVHTPQSATQNYLYTTLNATQVITLPKKITLELTGVYNSNYYLGSINVEGFGFLNAGIKKEFKNGGSLQFSVVDVLQSMNITSLYGDLTPEAYGNTGRVHFRPESTSHSVFKLSYFKSFGSKNNRNKNSNRGAEEEKSRLN